MLTKSLSLIAYASGIAANDPSCGKGPLQLYQDGLDRYLISRGLESHWEVILACEGDPQRGDLPTVADLCTRLAKVTCTLTKQKKRFAVLGGDHSSAIGTWGGVRAAQAIEGDSPLGLGLIWIDAHMDSHTFETTPSRNIHGMSLAALLGYGDTLLTQILTIQPKLNPENLSLIGVRSFETEEAALLQRLGVRIYGMEEIEKRGLRDVLSEAIIHVKKNTAGFGVSLDLDAIDPNDAPGVGVPVPHGLSGKELCQALSLLEREPQLLGVEVVEYNPDRDQFGKTETLIQALLISIFGTKNHEN